PEILPQRKSSTFPENPWSIGSDASMPLLKDGGTTSHVPFPDENGFPPFPQNHRIPSLGSSSHPNATMAHLSVRFLKTTTYGPETLFLGESIFIISSS